MNHFTRLIDLTSADEEYIVKLATSLAPCILRPRQETSLTMEEKHSYRLIRDLFAHKDAIFSELKRMSTMGASLPVASTTNRPRAISTDESNRKAHMEERTRALLEKSGGSRSRATSPAPSPRGHRRDKSSGGADTRFPIAPMTSPTSHAERAKRQSMGPILPKRTSLEVPDEVGMGLAHPSDGHFNGSATTTVVPEHPATSKIENESLLEKRNSLGRSGVRFVSGRRVAPAGAAPENSAAGGSSHSGVQLVDPPMDY